MGKKCTLLYVDLVNLLVSESNDHSRIKISSHEYGMPSRHKLFMLFAVYPLPHT